MSPGLMKMWISLSGIGFLAISVFLIYFSRYKIKNSVLKSITAVIAYISLVLGGFLIFLIVVSGPSSE